MMTKPNAGKALNQRKKRYSTVQEWVDKVEGEDDSALQVIKT